jgi:inosose dehydratase
MSQTGAVRVGCQANAWQREFKVQEHLAEALRQMSAAGYEGAELPVWSISDLAQPQAVRDLLAQHNLSFIAIHVGATFYDGAGFRDQALPALRRAAACASAAGAQGMVVSAAAKRAPLTTVPFDRNNPAGHPPAPQHERKTAAELRTQRDNLAEAARINHDAGLTTWYHNHFVEFDHDFEELNSILEIEPDLLSLCFDIGNAARALPGAALGSAVERYWDRIGYLHFKDIKGETLAEALGEGEIDFAPIGRLAQQRGFRGWATAEIEPARGMVASRSVAEDARLSCQFIRDVIGI